jgi:hypothetical protein
MPVETRLGDEHPDWGSWHLPMVGRVLTASFTYQVI